MLLFRAFVVRKYHERTGRHLDKMLHRSIVWHDEGKKDAGWQDACRRNRLQDAKVRHELVSLVRMHKAEVDASSPTRAAIAAHHGKLGYKYEDRWRERPEFQELALWEQFVVMGDRADSLKDAIDKRYEFDGPRAWLQRVDHRASAREGKDTPAEFRSFDYTFPFEGKERGVQQIVAELWDEPLAILRAPTGAGKTDAALLWAKHQIERGRADRLVIAMPTRFTANSLAISKPAEISSRGLYHSTSRFVHRAGTQPEPEAQKQADNEQDMARLLETPITVTTLDHLCICLTATREDHHSIFFNLAHSCIVVDEADFYDAFTQQNMVILLTVLRLLNVPVLVMSATVPESARQLYAGSGFAVPAIYEDTSESDRVRCCLKRSGRVAVPDDIASLLERALNGEPCIIYANTVRRAQAYYRWFQAHKAKFTKENVILYHSRFTEQDKKRKEELLYEKLGKEAWQTNTAHGVAVLTQIGELSVNISADLMISDLCPIDRLAQRVGRLARFHSNGGELFLVDPYDTDKNGNAALYPAPYGMWNGHWIASEALTRSSELLVEGEYTARRFVELVDIIYPTVAEELPERIRTNRRELNHLIELNWLLLPKEANNGIEEPDAERTETWFSRDMPAQRTLYVGYKVTGVEGDSGDDEPRSWGKYREFQLRHGVQCHAYEFNKALSLGLLQESRDKTTFTLGRGHQEDVWAVPSIYYDFEIGLHLTEESD